MLDKHFSSIEQRLILNFAHSSNLGHPVNKGTARETFVKEFLESHLGANVGIGNGEIIDANSKEGELRNQHDVILYRKDYPKLNFASNSEMFLAESVIATIEVKSTLDKEGLEQAIQTAYTTKKLTRKFTYMRAVGSSPPAIRNYLFAYNGPEFMDTVLNWFIEINKKLNIPAPKMQNLTPIQRLDVPSPSLDGLIVLQKGALHVHNINLIPKGSRESPNTNIFTNQAKSNNLLAFFLWLIEAINSVDSSKWDYSLYLPKE